MGFCAIGPIENFRKGWAIIPFVGEKPHLWVEDTETMPPKIGEGGRVRYYKSKCGLLAATNDKVPPIDPGNFQRCKRCAKAEAR